MDGAVPMLGDDALVFATVKAPTRWLAKSAFRRHYASAWIDERRAVIFSCSRIDEEATETEIAEAMAELGSSGEADGMTSRPHVIPASTAAILLFVALGHHPYWFYTFLRWAVCIAAIVVAWVAWHSTARWATWPAVGVAILFNPLAPVYLHRSTWRPIDILCAIGFAVGAATLEISDQGPRVGELLGVERHDDGN